MIRDWAYALRTFSRAKAFTAIAIVTLALGIGANTAIFSIMHAVLLRPLPYRDPQRLVVIWARIVSDKGMSKFFAQHRDLERWKERSRAFESLAGETWAVGSRILSGNGAPRNVLAIPATVDLFTVLGVPPMLGRTFTTADYSRACTMVLSHRFWQSALGEQRDISQLKLALDDQPCAVAGVMPPGFVFFPEPAAMWVLITPNDKLVRDSEHSGGVGVFGRLKPGVTIAQAESELKLLTSQLDGGIRYGSLTEPRVYPLQDEFTFLAGHSLRTSVIVLFGAVTLVLLIACVNVANLLLGRCIDRQRELAIRAALGSGRAKLVRQWLTESLLLSIAATLLGTWLAFLSVRQFRVSNPVEMPVGSVVEISMPVLAFTAFLAILTTALFGLIPAWRASNVDLLSTLKTGGRAGRDRSWRVLAKGLIVAEVSLSLVLLAGAGLLIESVVRFSTAPLGFDTRGLLTIPLRLPSKSYTSASSRLQFYDRATGSLRGIPEVEGVAVSDAVPLRGGRGVNALVVEGRPSPEAGAAVHDIGEQTVSPEYFNLMGIPVERGRLFEWSDREGATPVAVINEALARKYFPGEDAVGRRIRFYGELRATNPWLTIAGVVADERRTTPYQEMAWADSPIVYHALAQRATTNEAVLMMRTRRDVANLGAAVQQSVARIDPTVVVGEVETASHLVGRYVAYPRFRGIVLGVFAGLALLLAAVGLYGVLSQIVSGRTQEIGIRMALGAQSTNVLMLVVKEGMLVAGCGVVIGLALALWLSRFLASLLYGVHAQSPVTLAAVSLVLLSSAFLATYLPARRASRVAPMVALRHE